MRLTPSDLCRLQDYQLRAVADRCRKNWPVLAVVCQVLNQHPGRPADRVARIFTPTEQEIAALGNRLQELADIVSQTDPRDDVIAAAVSLYAGTSEDRS